MIRLGRALGKNKTGKRLCISIFCLMAIGQFQPVCAQLARESIITLVDIFAKEKDKNKATFNATDLAAIATLIDYINMAKFAIGANNCEKLSNSQRATYYNSFKSLIETRYYPRWHRLFSKSKFICGDESRQGNNILVQSTLTTGQKTDNVIWTLSEQSAKVIDLKVNDRDLLLQLHARFQKKLLTVGIDEFVKWLEKHCKQSPGTDERS